MKRRKIALLAVAVAVLTAAGCASRPYPAVDGLTADDVKRRLGRDWNMSFDSPVEIKSWYTVAGIAHDASTGADLKCEVAYYSNGDVWSVGYSVEWTSASLSAGFNVDAAAIAALSNRYLGYCGAIPFAGNDPSSTCPFIAQVLAQGNGAEERLVGGARVSVASHPDCSYNQLDVESATAGQ